MCHRAWHVVIPPSCRYCGCLLDTASNNIPLCTRETPNGKLDSSSFSPKHPTFLAKTATIVESIGFWALPLALVDLGACPVHDPPAVHNSFIFAYIFTKKCPHRRSTPPTGNPGSVTG